MCFDVPKLVWSPVCDHGHDEESRNGRDIKIDIFEAYVWTSEWFRVISGIFRSTGELREFAGEYMGLIGPYGNRGERPKGMRRAAPLWSELDKGCSSFFLAPLPLFPPFSYSNKEGGSPTPSGSRTPLGTPPPPCSFIYGGRGHL